MALTRKQLKDIANYYKYKPMYELAIAQAKDELIESGQNVVVLDLPDGNFMHLAKKKAYVKMQFEQKKFKEENPSVYAQYIKEVEMAESSAATYCTPDELQQLLEANAKRFKPETPAEGDLAS